MLVKKRYTIVATIILVICLVALAVPQERVPQKPLQVELGELSAESRASFDKLLGDAVARAANKHWQETGITDPIEIEFFRDFDRICDTNNSGTILSVYLVKPGEKRSTSTFLELRGINKSLTRYTCLTARVAEPFAIIWELRLSAETPRIEETIAFYSTKEGWRGMRLEESRENKDKP